MEENNNVNKKLNMKKLGIFCGVVLIVLLIICYIIYGIVRDYKISQTNEFKLSEIGYTENEIKVIVKSLDEKQIEDILSTRYKKNLTKFLKEKYFIYENLDRYLDYATTNTSVEASKVVSIVNTGADLEWYSNINETDASKKELMLVNKFNGLSEEYVPEDLINVSGTYGYSGRKVSKSIYDDLTLMLDAAKEDGYTMLVEQGYRSYEDQADAYKTIQDSSGVGAADRQAARAGHSDYQTGLGVSLNVYKVEEGKNASEGALWIKENAYKYGFIVRYPEGTSDITGFSDDAWRLRYVGREVSNKIYEEGITFDEYYAYYLNR